MDIEKRLSISFYQTVATLNENHKIYLAQHQNTGKIYIKKILDVYNKSLYETLMAHPVKCVPQIIEMYEEDNSLTIIEEYISGTTLADLLENSHRFSSTEVVNITVKLCNILEDLHSCNPPIIHRDIKPSNIIITPMGDIYLIDFNAAKYESHEKSEDTTLLGTKGYAAPEQYGFGVSNPQTDIYALGMLLNTLINGEFTSIIEGNEFTPIIKKCVELNPNDRYKSISEVRKQILKRDPSVTNKADNLKHNWQTYLPPGFRTLNIMKMLFATGVYTLLFGLCLTTEIKDASIFQLYYERLGLLIFFLLFIFVLFNYRGIAERFVLCRSDKTQIRILGRILFALIVSFVFFFLFILTICIFK